MIGTPEKRFWAKVDKRGPDECWPWTGATTGFGHGKLLVDGHLIGAHCFSFALHNGPIPEGLLVRHSCDNAPCCNPGHLLAGTQLENVADMDARGRRVNRVSAGEANPSAKLAEADVWAIRQLRSEGYRRKDLAAHYGVTPEMIYLIVSGKAWSSLVTRRAA